MTKVGMVLPAVATAMTAKVAEPVLVERGDDAEQRADHQRQRQRGGAELDRDRQPLGEEFRRR